MWANWWRGIEHERNPLWWLEFRSGSQLVENSIFNGYPRDKEYSSAVLIGKKVRRNIRNSLQFVSFLIVCGNPEFVHILGKVT